MNQIKEQTISKIATIEHQHTPTNKAAHFSRSFPIKNNSDAQWQWGGGNGAELRPTYDRGLKNQKPKPRIIIKPKSTKKLVDRRLIDLLITVASRFNSFEVVRKRTSLPR